MRVGAIATVTCGQASERQVEEARVGIAVDQGLFGHGSAIIART